MSTFDEKMKQYVHHLVWRHEPARRELAKEETKMDKQLLNAYSCVGRGWWPILDKYIPAILAIDAECDFEPKEKYGELRLQTVCSIDCDPDNWNEVWRLQEQAEDESAKVCEYCGKPGKLRHENRTWILTLCDDCDAMDKDSVAKMELEEQVLRGKRFAEFVGASRCHEMWEQWEKMPAKKSLLSETYRAWYRGLT